MVGLTGAVSLVATDALARADDLDAVERGLVRLLAGGVTAWVMHAAGAPASVVAGAIAGPVLGTTLDVAVAALPARRLEPPPQPLESAGLPWTPSQVAPR